MHTQLDGERELLVTYFQKAIDAGAADTATELTAIGLAGSFLLDLKKGTKMVFKPDNELHDENCEWREKPRIHAHDRGAKRSAYCLTHGQWAYEFSVKTVATFADGVEYVFPITLQKESDIANALLQTDAKRYRRRRQQTHRLR